MPAESTRAETPGSGVWDRGPQHSRTPNGSATWTIVATHELTQGLPPSWTDPDEGLSIVDPAPGSIVLVRNDAAAPLLTYSQQLFGRVVHVNNSLTYSTASIDPNVLTVIVNSVGYVDRRALFADGFESGDTSHWSGGA